MTIIIKMAFDTIGKYENIKLDLIDKKIFTFLNQNHRVPKTKLASKLNISVQKLQYRFERLKREKVIYPVLDINYSRIGLNSYLIFAKELPHTTIEKIIKNKSTYALVRAIGKYKYQIIVITKDIDAFCKENIAETQIEIHPIIRYHSDQYNPFNLTQEVDEWPHYPVKLDKKDYAILSELSKDSELTTLEISKRINVDRHVIKSRLDKLQNELKLMRFKFAFNLFKVNFISYSLYFKTVPELKKKLLNVIESNKYSGYAYETYEGFALWYMPSSHRELYSFTEQIEAIDPRISVEVLQTTDALKFDVVPPAVQEIFLERSKK